MSRRPANQRLGFHLVTAVRNCRFQLDVRALPGADFVAARGEGQGKNEAGEGRNPRKGEAGFVSAEAQRLRSSEEPSAVWASSTLAIIPTASKKSRLF